MTVSIGLKSGGHVPCPPGGYATGCDQTEGLLKMTGSHVHFKSGNISETTRQDRHQ